MRFAAPMLLWALAGVPVLAAGLVFLILRGRRALASIAEAHLLSRIVTTAGTERRLVKAGLVCAAAALLFLALARPQWGTTLDPVARRGVDVVIAVDVSSSMLVEDLRPSRLAKARSEAGRLLETLHGDRVSVVAFSGSAATLCPLTLDHAAARIFVDALEPGILTDAGTDLGTALRQVIASFRTEDRRYRTAVIFSDGEDHEGSVEEALAEAADQGIVIHTVGAGTAAGGPIPLRDQDGVVRGYQEDAEGRVVTSRLEEGALAALAERTGGKYLPATPGEGEIETIAEAIGAMDKREMQQRLLTQYEERFQVPLAFALALLIAEALIPTRRRPAGSRASAAGRSRAAAALAVLLFGWGAAHAASAPALVEEGNRLFKEGRYDEALKLYTQAQIEMPDAPEIHLNIGNVLYRKGEYEQAREAYARAYAARDRSLAGSARYNAGTANLSSNALREAVEEYREALKIDPEDTDARRNLELALRRLQMQQQPPQPQEGGKQDQEQGEQNSPQPRQDESNAQDPNQSAGDQGDAPREDEARKEGRDAERPEGKAERKERQEAERILDALRGEDRPRIDTKRQRRPENRPRKEW